MIRTIKFAVAGAVVVAALAFAHDVATLAGAKSGEMLSHDVYFTLKDNSPAAKKKLVDACKKHLSGHDGEVFFAAGTLAESLKREVNDLQFDVALHIVFKDMAAHDKYQDAKRHIQFIDENKDNWKKVRVFDSLVQK
jgi:hypothetical protein